MVGKQAKGQPEKDFGEIHVMTPDSLICAVMHEKTTFP